MKTIKMHGPVIDGSGVYVNREVPECDVEAYKVAGYEKGFKDGLQTNLEYGKAKDESKVKGKDAK